jgi:hypothetical protein
MSVVLTTDQKGAIAETAIIHEAVRLGVDVYRPVAEGGRYDLIFGLGHELVRVQCKSAPRYGDVIALRCYSSRRTANGIVNRPYTAGEVDALAAYCPELARCYYVPLDAFPGRRCVQLRLTPTRNNQTRGVHWASDFEFAATLGRLGAVAQLGERLAGSQKATGSSPVGSISRSR